MREDHDKILCHRCLGAQYISKRGKYGITKIKCPVCKGKGIWDWIEVITGNAPKEVAEKLMKRMRKD